MEQKRRLRIVEKRPETPDAATLVLEAADRQDFDYQPGQFISLIFNVLGHEKRRAYSFSSCPGADLLPSITIKRAPNGEFSNWLISHAQVGDTLVAGEVAGQFLLPQKPASRLFYLAAGSGITPIFSHLKRLLDMQDTRFGLPHSTTLLYANRDSRSTLFKTRLDAWHAAQSDHFSVQYFFSKEKSAGHGRLNKDLFEQAVLRPFGRRITQKDRAGAQFYLCAPIALMRMAEMALRTLGFPEENIHKEVFQPDTRLPQRRLNTARSHTVVAIGKDGQRIEFQVFEGETILNGALRQNIALPYTCKSGVCFTCLARCLRGEVEVAFVQQTKREGPGALVNTCIGYALTEVVELKYE